MDFSNRTNNTPAGPGGQNVSSQPAPRKNKLSDDNKLARIGVVVAAAIVAILLVALAVLAFKGSDTKTEASYVDTSKLQAVFLNTGQVYFGNVKSLNNQYLTLSNIYYLQTTGEANTANSGVTLVKLGCELHEPNDLMVINRDQVTFWENLQDSGQVAEAVAAFKKENPNGQKCADQSSSAGTNSTNATQNAPANSGAGAGATNSGAANRNP